MGQQSLSRVLARVGELTEAPASASSRFQAYEQQVKAANEKYYLDTSTAQSLLAQARQKFITEARLRGEL
eukprot:4143213-Alexandrium_andersonii.AAC.1